jgi:hypothetical protein
LKEVSTGKVVGELLGCALPTSDPKKYKAKLIAKSLDE